MAHVDLSSDENYEPETLLTHPPTVTEEVFSGQPGCFSGGLFLCGLSPPSVS